MRRIGQQLPQEACEEILTAAPRGFLAVLGDGGYPYAVPLNFVYGDGHIFFHCALTGHKMDALNSCDKACFTVIDEPVREPGDWWYHVRSVVCFGRLRVIEDEAGRVRRLRQLGRKYFPEGYDLEGDLTKNGPRAAVLDFTVEHMTGKRVREK